MTSVSSEAIIIDYYSDLLCIWAWVAERRIQELEQQYGGRVILHHHFIDVFGDVDGKINKQWLERGGYEAFADHVSLAAGQFEHLSIHPGWRVFDAPGCPQQPAYPQ